MNSAQAQPESSEATVTGLVVGSNADAFCALVRSSADVVGSIRAGEEFLAGEVETLDAGGLGMLVSLHNWVCANCIPRKLVNPSKRVGQMLELTRLTSVLHISSVEDVIQIFCGGDRAIENAAGVVVTRSSTGHFLLDLHSRSQIASRLSAHSTNSW